MLPAPDRRLTPAENARHAVELFGRDVVVDRCEELLSGIATDNDPRYPDIAWLKGHINWPAHWSRVWGARGLLHIGPPARPTLVVDALTDDAWRVREMVLKVIARHEFDDPSERVAERLEDPVERVRQQAMRAPGIPPSARNAHERREGKAIPN